MLTRIEVDGFKNLLGFSAEFGPFTCIAGPNAVGKSNLFDAIEFLSLLAEHPLDEAANLVRATPGVHEPARALFWNDGEVWAEHMRFAVELLTDGVVSDELGRGTLPKSTTYRYELELQYLEHGLRLLREKLTVIDTNSIRFPHHSSFARAHRFDHPREPRVIFDTHAGVMPDGSQPPQPGRATKTVLQLYQTAEHADMLAVRDEFVSWRRFLLSPSDLRKPHGIRSGTQMTGSGEHLPLLFKQILESEWDAKSLSASIIAKLGRIAGLRDVHVDEDDERELLTIRAESRSGEKLSARSMSEGTLRGLALVLLGLEARDRTSCIEEPETGFHPSHFEELLRILDDLAIDATRDVSADLEERDWYDTLPLRQVIVTTHSPDLVRRVFQARKADLLMATSASVVGPQGRRAHVLRAQPLRDTWRCHGEVRGVMLPMLAYVGYAELNPDEPNTASAAEDE